MVKINKTLDQLKGSVLAIDGVPVAKLGLVEYTSKKTGKTSFTMLMSEAFSGDVIATTKDNKQLVLRGMLFGKDASIDKPSTRVGDIL